MSTTGTLVVLDANEEKAGPYKVEASSPLGRVFSRDYLVEINSGEYWSIVRMGDSGTIVATLPARDLPPTVGAFLWSYARRTSLIVPTFLILSSSFPRAAHLLLRWLKVSGPSPALPPSS